MKIYSIGFTKTTAENFFERLKRADVARIVDARLNNTSQLAGFAKRDDLKYFANELCGADYVPLPELAPTKEIRDAYNNQKDKKKAWKEYEIAFRTLMSERKIESLDKSIFNRGCLLCSEDTPEYCHRRLVAEYLKEKWEDIDIEIVHL